MTDPDAGAGPDVEACTRCEDLVASRTQIVNGTGPVDADLLLVGEAPGGDEDRRGEPFVGRSGDVLDEALAAVGIDREDVRISNCVRCRPPENRDPSATELEHCRTYLDREVAAVDPTLVVALGKVPSEHLLGRDIAVTNEAGTIERVELGRKRRRVLICLHPAATLYDRSQADRLQATLATAADIAGIERPESTNDQASIDDF
jgi:DNA polymerase